MRPSACAISVHGGKKKDKTPLVCRDPAWQDGAGGLLLVAAACETGLVDTLTTAILTVQPLGPIRLARMGLATLQALLLTLLFLAVVGLRRPWDLRAYTGDGLAFLTGRPWTYGYRHVERFLAHIAQAGAAEPLTDALARWTAQLWSPNASVPAVPPHFYIDGHRKAVYTAARIPRGLVARCGKVEGCRALVLLHDAQGHPLLATTYRGDLHLTSGLPQILARYEQAAGRTSQACVIIDREGMAAEFLQQLVADGRVVITLLRADQYTGLESFTEVGLFEPFAWDTDGTVVHEVAPARFALALPSPATSLPLHVALIRDLRCQVPRPTASDAPPPRWDADLAGEDQQWWEAGWVATPAPAPPTDAKLIPIVATAMLGDARTLAQIYFRRWPAQENIIRDFLIPLGLDTNHGYTKTEVVNSEVAKRRSTLERRLATVRRWADGAGLRAKRADKRYNRLWEQLRARVDRLYRALNTQQAVVDAEIEELRAKAWRAYDQSNQEFRKQERYCQEQRKVLRALEDLAARERTMYELDHAKDQVMSVCKVALTNLVQWTRDQYFPTTYAHATWKRLAPFFQLPGRVTWESERVRVELRPFNDRQLNRDLRALCARVAATEPCLPDGRQVVFTVGPPPRLILDM